MECANEASRSEQANEQESTLRGNFIVFQPIVPLPRGSRKSNQKTGNAALLGIFLYKQRFRCTPFCSGSGRTPDRGFKCGAVSDYNTVRGCERNDKIKNEKW